MFYRGFYDEKFCKYIFAIVFIQFLKYDFLIDVICDLTKLINILN